MRGIKSKEKPESKVCVVCNTLYFRKPKWSKEQWEKRSFCSNPCIRYPQVWQIKGNIASILVQKKGKTFKVIVDSRDVPILSKYRWYISLGYATTSIDYKRTKMHHLIFGRPPKGMHVDHINRKKVDNRKINLRYLTPLENSWNKTTRGYCKRAKKWSAQITSKGVFYHLGSFDSKDLAHKAYLEAKSELHPI